MSTTEARFINPYTDFEGLLAYWDMVNIIKTKYDEGLEKGIEKGIEKIVIRCLKKGKTIAEIMDITGLTREQIEHIQRKMNKS